MFLRESPRDEPEWDDACCVFARADDHSHVGRCHGESGRVGGLIQLSHTAGSLAAGNFVMCEFCSNHEIEKRLGLFLQAILPVEYYGDGRRRSRLAPR